MMAKLVSTWQACSHTVSEANLLIPILLKLGWLGQDGMPITTNSTPCRRGKGSTLQLFGNDEIHVSERRQCWWELSWHVGPSEWCQRLITRHITVQFRRPQLFVPCLRNLSQCSRDFLHCASAQKFKQANAACLEPINPWNWLKPICLESIFGACDLNLTKSWVPLNIPDWPRVYKTYM